MPNRRLLRSCIAAFKHKPNGLSESVSATLTFYILREQVCTNWGFPRVVTLAFPVILAASPRPFDLECRRKQPLVTSEGSYLMRITALSEVLPGEPVTNRDLAARFGLHEQWLNQMTENRSRYFCNLDSPPGVAKSTSDLATQAGQSVLAAAGLGPADIDFLILTTASPDHLMPATVNLVADRLGINNVPTLQITSGC